jgi:hypothetical protein
MPEKCHHHPEKNAIATCHYCDRSFCDECLVHNRKAKYYRCKDEQNCLSYQESQFADNAYLQDHKTLLKNLDTDLHRLVEIMERMGEIGAIFEREGVEPSSQSESEAIQYIEDSISKLRIPGCFAYHLAQEGRSLLRVLALSCALGRQSSGNRSEKLDSILRYIDEIEPGLSKAAHDMEPYISKNPTETLVSLIAERRET